eukprot:768030_1
MKQQSRGDVFEGAKLSVEHAPPIVTHAPHTIPLQSHSHSNNHHNTNGNTLQNQPHVVQPRSFSYTSHSNGATHARVPSKPRTIKKIRLIIPRKRKLNQIESAPITNNYQSSDSKENKPNQPQQPPQKKQKLSPPSQQAKPIAPAVRSPITKRHKPQPPSYPPSLDVPIRNGTPSNVQKHNPMTSSLPPPPPLQSMSPPSKIKSPRNPYLHLQSQLKTHYAWPTHNGDGVSYSHICDECGQGFMNGKALGGHKGQHRKAKDCALYEQITRGHQGKNHQYYYPNNHNKNYKKKRTINKHNQRDVNGKYPSHDAQGVAYSHVCDVCHKGFSSGNALGGHRSVHKRRNRNKNGNKYQYEYQTSSTRIGTDSETKNRPKRKSSTKGKRAKMLRPNTKEWEEERLKAWTNLQDNNPNSANSYYTRYPRKGVPLINGDWSSDEHTLFIQRMHSTGVTNWGIFSIAIPGRIGKRCSEYYKHLIKEGTVKDINYFKSSDNKLRFKWISQLNIMKKIPNELRQARRWGFQVKNGRNTFTPPKYPMSFKEEKYSAYFTKAYVSFLQEPPNKKRKLM